MPLPLDVAVRLAPVAGEVSTTAAPGTTAPVESETVPVIAAFSWDIANPAVNRQNHTISERLRVILIEALLKRRHSPAKQRVAFLSSNVRRPSMERRAASKALRLHWPFFLAILFSSACHFEASAVLFRLATGSRTSITI